MTPASMKLGSRTALHVRALHALAISLLFVAFPARSAGTQDAGPTWRLANAPVLSVGRVDGPPDELFSSIIGAVRLADGRYVIADGNELRLSVYTADGRLQTVFGRDGEGPGELRSLAGIWSAGGDTIAVWDPRSQRITHFLPDGTVTRTNAPSFGPGGSPVARLPDAFYGAMPDGRIVLAWLSASRRVPDQLLPDTMTFGLFEGDGRFVRIIGAQIGMQRTVVPGQGGGPFVFSPWPWSAIVRDSFVYTNGLDGAIHFFDPRSDARRPARTLSVPGRPPSLAAAWNVLDSELPAAGAQPIFIQLANATNRSMGQVPHFGRMIADDRGRIWLKDYLPAQDAIPLRKGPFGAGGRWRIVETDGRHVATLSLPAGLAPIAIRGDDLLAIARDDLDVERFVVYRIIRSN